MDKQQLLAHEVMHTAYIIINMIDMELAQHQYMEDHPKVADAVERALMAVSDVYRIAADEE